MFRAAEEFAADRPEVREPVWPGRGDSGQGRDQGALLRPQLPRRGLQKVIIPFSRSFPSPPT